MTDIAAILAAVADLPPTDRNRLIQHLYDRYIKNYGLMAPERAFRSDLVEIHMAGATKRSALE